MKLRELFPYTFKALRHELGHDRPRDSRPMWQQRQSADSDFCRALVANGYMTEAQMQHAAQRYRLGRSRDGGVIFWQIDTTGTIFDGKIMCSMRWASAPRHRSCHRRPSATSARTTASTFPPNFRISRPSMSRPSVTSSSNRGKKSRISKKVADCRAKSDSALPECSTFAMSIKRGGNSILQW